MTTRHSFKDQSDYFPNKRGIFVVKLKGVGIFEQPFVTIYKRGILVVKLKGVVIFEQPSLTILVTTFLFSFYWSKTKERKR
jgi:hypothetical protein